MKRCVLFAISLSFAVTGNAAVYKCATPGGVTYSEQPCAKDAKAIDTRSSEPSAADVQAAKTRLKNDSRSSDVSKIEREIGGYKDDMDRELSALRNKQKYANNNLAGATWLNSISGEMDAVTKKYQIKIQEAQRRLDDARSSK